METKMQKEQGAQPDQVVSESSDSDSAPSVNILVPQNGPPLPQKGPDGQVPCPALQTNPLPPLHLVHCPRDLPHFPGKPAGKYLAPPPHTKILSRYQQLLAPMGWLLPSSYSPHTRTGPGRDFSASSPVGAHQLQSILHPNASVNDPL